MWCLKYIVMNRDEWANGLVTAIECELIMPMGGCKLDT
jgi:hypothetical protein